MPSPTRTTCAILTSRSTVLRSRHTKVRRAFAPLDTDIAGMDILTHATGGIFKLELFLPEDYPMTPPKIRFLTKIFHPNVDKLGRICLDVLKSTQTRSLLPFDIRHFANTWLLRQLVSRSANPNHPPLHPSPPRRSQPRRPSGCRRRQELERGRAGCYCDGQGVDSQVRQALMSPKQGSAAGIKPCRVVSVLSAWSELCLVVWESIASGTEKSLVPA